MVAGPDHESEGDERGYLSNDVLPPLREDFDVERGPGYVPGAILIGGTDGKAIPPRREVLIEGGPAFANFHPVPVTAFQPIAIDDFLGIGEVDANEGP